jgi:deoxyribodipyrimidine photo-lyase
VSPNHRPAIVWFRRDLRLCDNHALLAAAARDAPVLPVYIWASGEEGNWEPGTAARWWLHRSLQSLDASLRRLGSRLLLFRGPSLGTLTRLAARTGAAAVFWNRLYEPSMRQRDEAVEGSLSKNGLEVRTFNAALLHEPWEVLNAAGRPYQVFTPFWKACLASPEAGGPAAAPARLPAPAAWPDSLPFDQVGIEPHIDRAGGLGSAWQPGEDGARARLRAFLDEGAAGYPVDRDRPDRPGTSRLSPHLHFGEIGPRQIRHDLLRGSRHARSAFAAAARCCLRQLGWREFAHHVLHHFPHTSDRPLRPLFAGRAPRAAAGTVRAWERGETGYPLIDAGMRQLRDTGWMHNRVRMIVASFLVKDLLVGWKVGARWFWDTLVDADLANNTLGWQWAAGCGADAAPFFRVFNPVLQGRRFDPQGEYVRRWVPELARLPAVSIHAPWEASSTDLAAAGVALGRTYPKPIVDHRQRRLRALAAYKARAGGRRPER